MSKLEGKRLREYSRISRQLYRVKFGLLAFKFYSMKMGSEGQSYVEKDMVLLRHVFEDLKFF